MEKKIIGITLIMILCISSLVYASPVLIDVKAQLNKSIKIVFNEIEQTMTDVDGNIVFPLTYNGTTYVPLRAISKLFGTNVLWDQSKYAVLLGSNNELTTDNSIVIPRDITNKDEVETTIFGETKPKYDFSWSYYEKDITVNYDLQLIKENNEYYLTGYIEDKGRLDKSNDSIYATTTMCPYFTIYVQTYDGNAEGVYENYIIRVQLNDNLQSYEKRQFKQKVNCLKGKNAIKWWAKEVSLGIKTQIIK